MRHRKKGKKIGRTASHRKRTLQALSNALIENKRITTTVAKAKALRPFVEPLITRAKDDTQHNRRQVFRHLQNKESIKELFAEVAERVGDRPGGYTRIIKLGQRSGDGAELAMIELVDYNDVSPADASGSSSGRTRRGSGKGRRDSDSSTEESEPSESTSEADVSEESDSAEESSGDTEADTEDAEAEPAEASEETDSEETSADEDSESDEDSGSEKQE